MLKFDDIPDISHVASFLSKNNLNVASNDEVWKIARQSEDVPNFDNIFLELTFMMIYIFLHSILLLLKILVYN